ncbi:MAG: DNA helicase RecQ [Deltaproteobacteria bacterium]|nr:DNA helicase RecQ [Candidatus Anaeroferrophillus wilburensis]MBN2889402.1 DNA helicase RecQ [Deltaproteobacteria bacterium]
MNTAPAHILKQYWGHEGFLDRQQAAIDMVLAGRDSVTVLPTGGGKSVCYQVPALLLAGLAIVVSPLIALMKDQVDALRLNGVRAAAVNSSLTMVEKRDVAAALRANELSLLYISPEKLVQKRTLDFFKTLKISFLAIDEAHCISQWGHDFRPEYRQLGGLKEHFPGLAIHAYTATATETVRRDIADQLKLDSPHVLVGAFDRPNLTYRVRRRSANHSAQIIDILQRYKQQSGIIYCQSRREVDQLNALLAAKGFRSYPYHAGMDDGERRASQEAFIHDEAGIMVATVAFGMGVDKSNIRLVLHSGMPKALENYQQESGRAGRDGLPAECILFHGSSDLQRWQRTLAENGYGEGLEGAKKSLQAMVDYVHGDQCRHRTLVGYFDQELEPGTCGSCDICLGELISVAEPLSIGQKILAGVLRQGENYGADYTALVLRGSNDRRIKENGHNRLTTWGLLSRESLATIKDWIDQLICQGFIAREQDYHLLKVTSAGHRLLKGETVPSLLVAKEPAKNSAAPTRSKLARELSEAESQLFEKLRELRRELAAERGVPPYIIFSDAALYDMVCQRPPTLAAFKQVKGVGELKLRDFGVPFTDLIRAYCIACGLGNDSDSAAEILS